MSQQRPKLIYGHDPLCGWCYGLIPAMRHFSARRPDIEVEVLPGGLYPQERAAPYSLMVDYITEAVASLEQATGQRPKPAFFDLISSDNAPLTASAPPSLAILQMQDRAPERHLEFTHLLQEAHFEQGRDLNAPDTYVQLCKDHGFPDLDVGAIGDATDQTPPVKAAFGRAAALNIRSYPTILVLQGTQYHATLPSIYHPHAFLAEVEKHI